MSPTSEIESLEYNQQRGSDLVASNRVGGGGALNSSNMKPSHDTFAVNNNNSINGMYDTFTST